MSARKRIEGFGLALAVLLAGACGGSEESAHAVPPQAAPDAVEYVGQEEVLRGLDAVYVNPSFLEVRVDALRVPSDLALRIERKLEAAGIRPLTVADLERDPGLAELQIYPSASGNGGFDGERDACCTANVWISVLEGTALDRDPDLHRRLPVWGAGSHDSCAAAPVSVDEVVLGVVDRFIADVRAANAEDASAPLADRPAGDAASPQRS